MNGGLDLKFLLNAARNRFWHFLIPFLALVMIGTGIVMSLPAVYTAEAKILVEAQQIPDELVKSTVTQLADQRLQVIEQRVMTRDNLLSLVEKFDLFANRKDLSRTDIVDLMRDRVAIKPLSLNLAQSAQRGNSLAVAFSTTFDYEAPDTAVKVVNELVTFILNEDARARTEQATETARFLEREIERLTVELKALETQIVEFKQQNGDALPEKQDLNISLLTRSEEEISTLQRQLIEVEDKKRLLQFESSVRGMTAGPGNASGGGSVQARLKEAQAEYAVKKGVYAPNHPEMRALKKAIDALEKELAASLKSVDPGQDSDPADTGSLSLEARVYAEQTAALDRAKQLIVRQLAETKAESDKLRKVLSMTSEVGTALGDLERKRTSLQRNLEEISAKYSQARLGQQLETEQQAERFEVLEQPTLPTSPSKPKRVTLLAIVLALATFSGTAVSGGAELLDNTIRRSKDLSTKLNRRPIVVVPHIGTRAEERQRKRFLIYKIAGVVAVLLLFVLFVHVFYRPVDVLFFRLLAMTPWY
jgi:uncharacterized protein involved in exopolysaccharide biosynthesis